MISILNKLTNKLTVVYLITLLTITSCKEQVNVEVIPTVKVTPVFVSDSTPIQSTPTNTPSILKKIPTVTPKTPKPINLSHNKDTYVFVKKIGSEGLEDGQFKNLKNISNSFPIDIAVDREGNLYATDPGNNRIQKFDSIGNFILKWTAKNYNNEVKYPNGIAVDTKSNIYITEDADFLTKMSRRSPSIWNNENTINKSTPKENVNEVEDVYNIQKFTSNGKFIAKWITKGPFAYSGIIVGRDEKIYQVDPCGIYKYDSSGNVIKNWDFPFKELNSGGASPMFCGMAIDTKNNIFVLFKSTEPGTLEELPADRENFIMKYDSDGHLIKKYKELHDEKKNILKSCQDIAIDSEDNIFISVGYEYSGILKFDSNLKLITRFGIKNSGEGQLKRPFSIAVDSEGNVYVVDIYDFCIKKFAPKLKKEDL